MQVEGDQLRWIVTPGERILRLSQRDRGSFGESSVVCQHQRRTGGIADCFRSINFLPAVLLRTSAGYRGKIARPLELDRLRKQSADVAVGPNRIAPAGAEFIEKNSDRRPGAVSECANERGSGFIVANVFCHPGGTLSGELHRETLTGVLRKSFLNLEHRLEAVATGIERTTLGAKQQRRLDVVSRRFLVRK